MKSGWKFGEYVRWVIFIIYIFYYYYKINIVKMIRIRLRMIIVYLLDENRLVKKDGKKGG